MVGRSPDLTRSAVREPLLPLVSTPCLILGAILTHENTPRRGTPIKGRTAHRRHTRQRPGKRRRRSEPGTSEDRPGTLQEHHEDRKQSGCTRARSGGARDAAHQPTLPRLGGRRAKETTHGGRSETRDRERRRPRRASREHPRTTARSAWELSQGSGRITAPLPSTHHRQRWGGETRGPLAEREERPPFAMNVRPSPGAA